MRGGSGVAWAAALTLGLTTAAGAERDARWLEGYATAIAEREFGAEGARVVAREDALEVAAPGLSSAERQRLARTLKRLEGVNEVAFAAAEPAAVGTRAAPGAIASEHGGITLLPERELFPPLLADPRWPHFSAALHFYLDDEELTHVAAVSFGEALPLLGWNDVAGGALELALHAGVFSIFDMDSDSFDLINSDFLVAAAGTWRRGDTALLARFLHQSSHLGDEYLLRDRVDRINLSYEAVELMVSQELFEDWRVYLGAGKLLRRDPRELDPFYAQAGFEWLSGGTHLEGALRPLAAIDLASREEDGWDLDVAMRAGVQVENPRWLGKRLQLLLDYYEGRSPNGQLFQRDVEYWGFGAHLHF